MKSKMFLMFAIQSEATAVLSQQMVCFAFSGTSYLASSRDI